MHTAREKFIQISSNIFFILISLFPLTIVIGPGPWNVNFYLLTIFGIFTILLNLKKFNLAIKNNYSFLLILFLFSSYIIINSFVSEYKEVSFTRSIPFIKYLFIIFGILFLRNNISLKRNHYFFFTIILITSISIVIISSFFELFRIDFPLYTKSNVNYRLNGPFGDEAIVGSYLITFLPISIFLLNRIKLSKFILYLFISFVTFIIIASGERMAIIMTCALLFLYFFKDNLKVLVLFSSLPLILVLILFYFQSHIFKEIGRDSYTFRIHQTLEEISNPFETSYFKHFHTAFEIFNRNKIFGTGVKSFRYECAKKKYDQLGYTEEERCRTHPHNLHLEILSETGILGYLIFLMLIISFAKNYLEGIDKDDYYILILALIITFFPIKVSGSFFSSIYGGFYMYQVLVLILFARKIK